jgi:ATP-dependent helicase Lhr and Lhr-like helicase
VSFDRLHPALQHHIVNSLGWRSLRSLQERAIEPLIEGKHALLLGPTAGGKTEAAIFPLLSRMLTERWFGLSLLYVCPLRALLNNLEFRLQRYASYGGRRAAMWHGDVGDAARRAILADPPDLLLTTPESLEVMLVTPRVEHQALFSGIQAVVIDEVHAFAGDDRGWHLLAVLERVMKLAGRDIQRVGLSATVGNPDELLEWQVGSSRGPRQVVSAPQAAPREADVQLDYVGSTENAATVIARLHQGEKRLVFCDSRARVEDLAAGLVRRNVNTFVSHSSLSVDQRRRAEEAFASASDCVIVATSTLELGIDVGDLNRVIQIDAPTSVASFLQRLGRTGRREGTTANCLFLATAPDSFVRAAGLTRLWKDHFVEPVMPPPAPLHLLAQQILALSLQESGIGVADWSGWVGAMPGFRRIPPADVDAMLSYMGERELLWNDHGILSVGRQGEQTFGRRHFLDLLSSFTTEPLFSVKHGKLDIGRVHQSSFAVKEDHPPVLLLAGLSWVVTHIDWDARVAFVEPTKLEGKSRWLGSGQALRYSLCQAIQRVLGGEEPGATLSKRGEEQLAQTRSEFPWLTSESTHLVTSSNDRLLWWTFAGLFANSAIAEAVRVQNIQVGKVDNFVIALDADTPREQLDIALKEVCALDGTSLRTPVSNRAVSEMKFSECLPPALAVKVLSERMTDAPATAKTLGRLVKRTVLAGS